MDMQAFLDIKKENTELFRKIIVEGQEKGVFRKDVNIQLISPTIMGILVHFQMNRLYFEQILDLRTEEDFENYILNELTVHIKQTIKALLANEN
jgi:hypothetical protein